MLGTIALLMLAMVGCSEGATLVHDTGQGGIVTYLYKAEAGPMFSRYRGEALGLIEKKCPAGYAILQEGETQGYSSVQGIIEGTEDDSRSRRWGLKFRCKEH